MRTHDKAFCHQAMAERTSRQIITIHILFCCVEQVWYPSYSASPVVLVDDLGGDTYGKTTTNQSFGDVKNVHYHPLSQDLVTYVTVTRVLYHFCQ